MEIQYGAVVVDRNGKVLGTVSRLIRNVWTGEISKFVVGRKLPDMDLFFSPQDVLEMSEDSTWSKVNISADELNEDR